MSLLAAVCHHQICFRYLCG